MKNVKTALAIVLVLVLGYFVISMSRGTAHMSWEAQMPSQINALAVCVEMYRTENGNYPVVLNDLKRAVILQGDHELMELLAGRRGGEFGYQVVSNGFIIAASRDGGLFTPSEVMTKKFVEGEALNERKRR